MKAFRNSKLNRSFTFLLLVTVCLLCGCCSPTPSIGQTFTDPIISNGADPWVTYRDGYYYLTYTTGSNVQIHRATRLTGTKGIGAAPVITAFYPPAPYNQDVWAPELHFLANKAYLVLRRR
jgi:GH43 family beta-xylosidase